MDEREVIRPIIQSQSAPASLDPLPIPASCSALRGRRKVQEGARLYTKTVIRW
ncbi:hypothetical protein E2C01_102800 [Portunus trituberculatus]|uniref:Uncharacterized protein n=1 Tax=Portunus trituberculatus TaxID=210409 RepID=A0A5B7KDI2_PORTR|nr:hypothetical protein [Portunus trituberculatus]